MAYGSAVMGASAYRSRRPATNFNDRGNLANEQGGAYTDAAGMGDQANQTFLNNATTFDAKQGLNDYAKGAWSNVSQGLDQTLARLKGQAVGAGRADSGFFDQDQGDVIRNVTSDFTNNLATKSLDAQGQQLSNTQALGQFGQNQQNTANDLLTSRREELENNARDEAEKKAKKKSGIGSALGGILGAATGFIGGGFNPATAALGYKAGSAVGGMF